MRRKKLDAVYYNAAKEALRNFLFTFQQELEKITHIWSGRRKKYCTSLVWLGLNDSDIPEYDGVYGTEEGMYLLFGECYIWFPKTSNAYSNFFEAMVELYDDNDDFLIPVEIAITYNGKKNIEYKMYIHLSDSGNEKEYELAKLIINDLKSMLDGFEYFGPFTYYEGDEFGNTKKRKKYSNYHVGLKASYNV